MKNQEKDGESIASKLHPDSKAIMSGFQPAVAYHISTALDNFKVTGMDSDNSEMVKEGMLIGP